MRFAAPLPLAASCCVIGTNTKGSDSVVGGLWTVDCGALDASGVSSMLGSWSIKNGHE